jgi:hypothetical protein
MKQDYSLEIAEISATVVLSLLSLIVPNVSIEGTFIVASFGTLIALGTFMLKRELTRQFTEKLELWKLLSEITDGELRQAGLLIISDARDRMRKLSKGLIELGTEDVYSSAIAKMRATRKGETVLAVHTSQEGPQYLHAWEDFTPLRNYYTENKKATERGVVIERVFVIRRSDLLDPVTGHKDEKSIRILKEHQASGINVTVAFMEDMLDTSLVQDLIVFGTSVVETHEMALGGRYHQVTVHRDKAEVDFCMDRFHKLKVFGRPLDVVLNEMIPSSEHPQTGNGGA